MRRILFTIVSVFSLLVFLGVCTLWVRSYWYADQWAQTDAQGRTRVFQSQVGAAHWRQVENNAGILGMPTIPTWSHHTVAPGTAWDTPYAALTGRIDWRAAGFAVVSGQSTAMTPVVFSSAANSATITLSNPSLNNTITSLTPATIYNPSTINVTGNARTNVNSGGVTLNPGGGIVINGSGSIVSGLNVGGGQISMTPGATITANTISFVTNTPQTHLAVIVPYWCPAALAGILPLVFAFKARRWHNERRRARLGLCRCCGYDLRASTDRCPECGTSIT